MNLPFEVHVEGSRFHLTSGIDIFLRMLGFPAVFLQMAVAAEDFAVFYVR